MNDLLEGLVISHLGQGIAVEMNDQIYLCHPRRKLETVAVGDRVNIEITGPEQGRIDAILPRRSLLKRPARNQKTRPVAANIDSIYIVFASEPACDFLLLDQFLAICENNSLDATLIHNKTDLPVNADMENELQAYQLLGYRYLKVSAHAQIGLDELQQSLQNRVTILTGQSGVGKSSLSNTLLPDKSLRTNAISEISKLGRHTTTAATLYHLPNGGDLIDSPGVAIFGLADLTERQLAWGFREFQPLLEQCQFNDCRHVLDKGCAIRKAADSGKISSKRYQRFLKLREKMPLS